MSENKNFYIILVLLSLVLVYSQLISLEGGERLCSLESTPFPSALDGWKVTEMSLRDFEQDMLRPDSYLYFRYDPIEAGPSVYAFVAYFREQRIGFQIHSPLNCLPGSGWNIVEVENFARPYLEVPVRRIVAERYGEYSEVYYWFVTPSGIVSSEYMLKLSLLKSGLLFRSKDALLVRISFSRGDEAGRPDADVFLRKFSNALKAFLGGAKGGRSCPGVSSSFAVSCSDRAGIGLSDCE